MAKKKIILREAEIVIEYRDNKLVDVTGDATLSDIVRRQFRKSIDRVYGFKDGKTFYTAKETLKPGEDNYIETVLYERIQNEHGMRLGELVDVS